MKTFNAFVGLYLVLVILACHSHGQIHSTVPSLSHILSTLSTFATQRTRPPEILQIGVILTPQANKSGDIKPTDAIPHASLRQPPRYRPHNGSTTSHLDIKLDSRQNATNSTFGKRPEGHQNSTDSMPVMKIVADTLLMNVVSANKTVQTSNSGMSAVSFTTYYPGFNQSTHGGPSLAPGFIRATGAVLFGLPPKSLSNSASKLAAEPSITLPPAPPIRPDGLNLTGVKAVKVFNPAWSVNTSITIVSPGGTQPTVVPVLVKAAGVGIAVFGLEAALEAGAPLLEAGEAVEAAEEEATGEEDEESDDEKLSTSSTSTSGSSPSSTSTSSSARLSASSSSSVSSSTQSSSTSTTTDVCSNPTDFPQLGDTDDEDTVEAYENSKLRRSRIAKRQLQQSGPYVNLKKPVTRLGSCQLDKSASAPPFWKANSLMGKTGNSAYWYMPVPEDPANLDAAPTYTTASTAALRTLSPSRKSVVIGGSRGYRTNVDHVYEVSLLKNFFNYYLAQRSVCRTFNDEFMINSTAGNQASRLSQVFAQLPGVQFGGLAGMDQRLNSIKAYFFQAGEIQNGLGFRANGLCDSIKNLQMAGMIMDMLHSVELRKFFSDANLRIYQALLGVDHAISSEASKCNQLSNHPFSWAEEYKGWIEWFLAEREYEIQNWARSTQKSILNSLSQKTTEVHQASSEKSATVLDPSFDDDRKRMDGFMKSAYSQNSHWSFNFNLQYPTNALPIAKRDDGCIRSILQTSTTMSAASATKASSPTSTVTQSASATAEAGPAHGGDVVQPHKAPLPDHVVNFINNENLPQAPAHSNSANQLNNGKSANQFNNAIQRMSPPAAIGHPSGSGVASTRAPDNIPTGSNPANA